MPTAIPLLSGIAGIFVVAFAVMFLVWSMTTNVKLGAAAAMVFLVWAITVSVLR